MIVSKIAIYKTDGSAFSDGTYVLLAPEGTALRTGQASVNLPVGFDEATHVWDASKRTMVEDAAKVETVLILAVKTEAERRKMLLLTPGGAKPTEYADQAAEVRFFWSLGGTVQAVMGTLGLWTPQRRATVFPCAVANAAEFGDTIDKAIGRFSVGMSKAATKETLAAREAKICTLLRAATSAAEKRAVASSATWPA